MGDEPEWRVVTRVSAMAVRVAVAEDEALIRLDLVEMLQDAGYEVVGQAATGEAAVDLVRRLTPDVLLLDVRMPAMDGLSAAEAIATEQPCAIVMLTAFSDPELINRATEAGVTGYLVKPVSAADLIPAIEVALARHRESRQLRGEVANLTTQLNNRKLLDRAKAVLARKHGFDDEAAYQYLRKTAMDQRCTIADVATALLATDE